MQRCDAHFRTRRANRHELPPDAVLGAVRINIAATDAARDRRVTLPGTVTQQLEHARTLLNQVPTLQRLTDLDLLVFFAKHPNSLLSPEQLARLLGHPLSEIARSLDSLLGAGFVTRAQKQYGARPARMYAFAPGEGIRPVLAAVVTQASTRERLCR
jgi:predicted transcriptional regulator